MGEVEGQELDRPARDRPGYGTPLVATLEDADVVVVGGGAAGLHVALEPRQLGARTTLVSRKPLAESSSFWAQGGLAAALAADDSPERHAADTLAAGRGLCRTSAVEVLTREAPAAVEQLMTRGVRFDTEPGGELALGLEGGHSARRIVHAGGSETGRAITSRLAELVAAERAHRGTRGRLGGGAVERRRALPRRAHRRGRDRRPGDRADHRRRRRALVADHQPPGRDRRRARCWPTPPAAELADLELCQFHPTALALPGSAHDGALITEAVRGEGATLLDAAGGGSPTSSRRATR